VNARGVEDKHAKPGAMQRLLDGIERVGNKVPHPALIFLALIVIVIVLSQILSCAGTSVTTEIAEPGTAQVAPEYPGGTSVPGNDAPPAPPVPDFEVRHETITAESLLTGDGIRFIFTTAVQNFNDFGVVAVILVAMIGVGVAEEAGLIAALIRKMVKVAPKALITFIIVLLGGISSVASDAGYLVLIPLGAVAFLSVGRHPVEDQPSHRFAVAQADVHVVTAHFENQWCSDLRVLAAEVRMHETGVVNAHLSDGFVTCAAIDRDTRRQGNSFFRPKDVEVVLFDAQTPMGVRRDKPPVLPRYRLRIVLPKRNGAGGVISRCHECGGLQPTDLYRG